MSRIRWLLARLMSDQALVLPTTVLRDWRRIAALVPPRATAVATDGLAPGRGAPGLRCSQEGLGPAGSDEAQNYPEQGEDSAMAGSVELMDIEVLHCGHRRSRDATSGTGRDELLDPLFDHAWIQRADLHCCRGALSQIYCIF